MTRPAAPQAERLRPSANVPRPLVEPPEHPLRIGKDPLVRVERMGRSKIDPLDSCYFTHLIQKLREVDLLMLTEYLSRALERSRSD